MFIRIVVWLFLSVALSACASVDYSKLPTGSFAGSLFVMWVGEGGSSGDGRFLFVPDPGDPLIFRRSDPQRPGSVIRPGLMYTDGGSIPKIAQVFNGLSPWGYAPAYMIHDWIFTARHCIVDGEDNARFDQVRGVTFRDSAEILGEAIHALIAEKRVQSNDLAAGAVTTAVDSFVAKRLWDETGACKDLIVKPEDVAAAEAAIPGSSRLTRRSFRLPQETAPVATRQRAMIISQIRF
ncbi:hypothetical protein [Phyllobacterium bourgognense]|uniref:DUF1353 domain-containing protein n=1 Tax=Phyllobacterium bourgognense TaxID=314236 RepID=A0A368Z3X3_9HYPH|nr:hypothetical protein [Phyllobacterium bourgognense]RCW86156.1 hypothetical protein C7476_102135 [Phyllobacterium bourgognense]